MFSSIGWTEMMVIALVAVVFVGPKDLPGMLRAFGKFSRKARGMATDFQRQVDDALRDAELEDVRKSIEDVRSLDPKKALRDRVLGGTEDDLREAAGEDTEDDYDPAKLFDESKAPEVDPPQKVDVDAALAREEERIARVNAEAAKAEAASAKPGKTGTNGLPGFEEPTPAATKPAPKKAAPKTRSSSKKPAAAKAAPKRKPAARKKAAKVQDEA